MPNKAEIVLDRHTAAETAVLISSARVRKREQKPTNVGFFAWGGSDRGLRSVRVSDAKDLTGDEALVPLPTGHLA